jgi:type I restriction enzyme M protein
MSQANQQDIESWLWESANILRGPVDPANLRDFVFPLLFLKRLSDTWDEEQAAAIKTFGIDIDRETAADFHAFQIPDGCHWTDLRRAAENHGVVIQNIMQKIEEANPTRLAQIFGNAPWADHNKMPPERLERLVSHFSQRDLSPSKVSNDLLGGGYEYLLKRFSDESSTSAGQFFTPRAVVHLLVRILGPEPTDSIYDPACGSAGMLIEAATEVKQSGGSVQRMRFYGQEVNQTSAAIGRMNLLIHEVEDAQIRRDDTLNNPKFVNSNGKLDQFDLVVANPPFSLKDWGAAKWATDPHKRAIGGVPPKNNGDFAWVQHMLASMRPETGRVGVVMPHGVLFRGGAEGAIRKHLIESDLLETVIGLAPNLFYGTTIPASLLIFKAKKGRRASK